MLDYRVLISEQGTTPHLSRFVMLCIDCELTSDVEDLLADLCDTLMVVMQLRTVRFCSLIILGDPYVILRFGL